MPFVKHARDLEAPLDVPRGDAEEGEDAPHSTIVITPSRAADTAIFADTQSSAVVGVSSGNVGDGRSLQPHGAPWRSRYVIRCGCETSGNRLYLRSDLFEMAL